jgi:hypothetical protein
MHVWHLNQPLCHSQGRIACLVFAGFVSEKRVAAAFSPFQPYHTALSLSSGGAAGSLPGLVGRYSGGSQASLLDGGALGDVLSHSYEHPSRVLAGRNAGVHLGLGAPALPVHSTSMHHPFSPTLPASARSASMSRTVGRNTRSTSVSGAGFDSSLGGAFVNQSWSGRSSAWAQAVAGPSNTPPQTSTDHVPTGHPGAVAGSNTRHHWRRESLESCKCACSLWYGWDLIKVLTWPASRYMCRHWSVSNNLPSFLCIPRHRV